MAARRLRGGTTNTWRTGDRRVSVVCPLRSRRPSDIRQSKRLRIVGVSSQYGQIAVAVAVASISRSRRIIVASSSCRCRIVVALSSHHRRIVGASSARRRYVVVTPGQGTVVASSPCRRRVVTFLAVKTPPFVLETIPHMSSELR